MPPKCRSFRFVKIVLEKTPSVFLLIFVQNFDKMEKVKYDKETDVLYIQLAVEPIAESDEQREGVILDFNAVGKIVGIEILDASQRVPQPTKMAYELV